MTEAVRVPPCLRLSEGKPSAMDPCQIDAQRCKGCGLCVEFCPRHCLEMSESLNSIGYHPAHLHQPEKCTSCALCAEMCPETGIRVFRKRRPRRA